MQLKDETNRQLQDALLKNRKLSSDIICAQDQLRRQQDVSDALREQNGNLKEQLTRDEREREAQLSAHFQHIKSAKNNLFFLFG